MQKHFGVYGLVTEHDNLLLVKKVRGPYAGLLDLPGGKPEENKCFNDTLNREFFEEVGCGAVPVGPWCKKKFNIFENESNTKIVLEHSAAYCRAKLKGSAKLNVKLHDVNGAEWMAISSIENHSGVSLLVRQTCHLVL